jgi:hypothetical protein
LHGDQERNDHNKEDKGVGGRDFQPIQAASALAINAAAIVTPDRDFSRGHSLRVIS